MGNHDGEPSPKGRPIREDGENQDASTASLDRVVLTRGRVAIAQGLWDCRPFDLSAPHIKE